MSRQEDATLIQGVDQVIAWISDPNARDTHEVASIRRQVRENSKNRWSPENHPYLRHISLLPVRSPQKDEFLQTLQELIQNGRDIGFEDIVEMLSRERKDYINKYEQFTQEYNQA